MYQLLMQRARRSSQAPTVEAPVGKIDFLLSKNCVFYRIAIERGAQCKVYGTLFNILRQVLLIRHPRAACRFSELIRPREASERPRDRPRSSQRPRRYCCRTCTCAARRARKDQPAKRPKRFGLSRTRAAGRWKEQAPRAIAADAVQPTRSPLSRFGAAERRSREHGSDQIHDCQRADKQPTMPLLAKQLQPPSAAQAAKPGA